MKVQLKVLQRLGAPTELIDHFQKKWKLNETLSDERRASPKKLLEEACRDFGFSEILPEGWF